MKPPGDSRRSSPAKSRVTSTGAAKGGPAHGTRAPSQPGQCLLCRQIGHLARECLNRGMCDDSGINLKRAFGSFVGMTGGCISAGSHDDSTTGSRARVRLHYVSRARCSLAFSFVHLGATVPLLVSLARAIEDKTQLFCWDADGTRASSTPSPTAANTTHSADHRERSEIDRDLSLLTSLQHLEPLNESSIIPTEQSMPITFGRRLCRVGSFRGGRCQRPCVERPGRLEVT